MSDTASLPAEKSAPKDKEKKERKPIAPVTAQSLAELATGMSRFLGMFASFKPLQEENLSFAEWVVLCELKKGPVHKKKIARTLGSDSGRVDQLTDSLIKAGFVDRSKSAGDDKVIGLTPAGEERLATVNGKLTPLFAKALAGKDRAIRSGNKSLRVLTRTVTTPRDKEKSTDGKAKRKENKEKRVGDKAKRKEGKADKAAAKADKQKA